MSNPSTAPDPDQTPGLEPGGSVPPGETPPAEGSISGISHPEPELPSQRSSRVVYALIIAVVLVVVVMLVAYAVGIAA